LLYEGDCDKNLKLLLALFFIIRAITRKEVIDLPIYESIFILKPDLMDENVDEVVKKIHKIVKDHSGKIMDNEIWGKRRMAYEVDKERYGIYALIHFEGEGKLIRELERNYRLMGDVMKYIIIRLNKRELAELESDKKEKKKK
jgi:small subunit ribosomal protein S6